MNIKQRKAVAVLDAYKLGIFKKHLDAAGYKYEEHTKSSDGCVNYLEVVYTDLDHLGRVIRAADEECAAMKARKH